jgi:hypothetical protein
MSANIATPPLENLCIDNCDTLTTADNDRNKAAFYGADAEKVQVLDCVRTISHILLSSNSQFP